MSRIQEAFVTGGEQAAIDEVRSLLDADGLGQSKLPAIDAERFAQIRVLRDVTQQKLAEAIGVKPSVISHVELAQNSLTLPRLVLAAAALDVPLAQLLVGAESSEPARRSGRHLVPPATHRVAARPR